MDGIRAFRYGLFPSGNEQELDASSQAGHGHVPQGPPFQGARRIEIIADDQPVAGGIKNASIPLFIFFSRMGGQAFIHNDYRLLSSMA